ncbi:hypothetical protein OAS39_10100 [Pirellulales bacterium]|nr:hypothetical protein [Pirellulales bacterium]
MKNFVSMVGFWIRRTGLALRIILAIAGTCFVADLAIAFFSSTRAAQPTTQDAAAPVDDRFASFSNLENGHWTFAGDNLSMSVRQVDDAEAKQILAKSPPAGAPAIQGGTDAAERLQQLIRYGRALPEQAGEYTKYRFESADMQMILYTRVDHPQEHLISASIAIRVGQQWMIFQRATARHGAAAPDSGVPLISSPAAVQPLAVRYADGKRHVELSSGHVNSMELVEHWRAAGWEVATAPSPDSNGEHFVCRKRGKAVFAKLSHRLGRATLFVIAIPSQRG